MSSPKMIEKVILKKFAFLSLNHSNKNIHFSIFLILIFSERAQRRNFLNEGSEKKAERTIQFIEKFCPI